MNTKITLLPYEDVVTTFHNGILTLTTKRVRYHNISLSDSKFVSMALDSIASCGLITKSYPVLILFALIAIVVGLANNGVNQVTSIAVGVFLFISYFMTRRAFLSIASSGGEKIEMLVKGIKPDLVISFLELVESEKLKQLEKKA